MVNSTSAGLGFYNRSEFSITAGFYNINNESSYLGNNSYDYRSNFGINNLGAAFNRSRNSADNAWRGGTFAITFQRSQNLHNKFTFEGNNGISSYTDVFPVYDTGTERELFNPGDPLLEAAIDADLLGIFEDPDEPGTYFYDTYFPYNFYSTFPRNQYPVFQRGVVEVEGRSSQLSIAYGGNIGDKYYIGASVGFTTIDQEKTIRFQETADQRLYVDYPDFEELYGSNYYLFETRARDEGNGVNATLGFIARPISAVTLGISYKTPTLYTITSQEDYTFNTRFRAGGAPGVGYGTNMFEYNLKTPGSITLSGALFAEKSGFITADVEFTNYSKARLTDDFSSLSEDNAAIKDDYRSAVNLRIGGEYRYNILRLRAGYGLEANPYRSRLGTEIDGSRHVFSAGAGVRLDRYFIDFALSQRRGTNYYSPYSVEDDAPLATMDNKATTALLTLGITF